MRDIEPVEMEVLEKDDDNDECTGGSCSLDCCALPSLRD